MHSAIKRTSLYVFNSFQSDASLTSLLLDETSLAQLLLNTSSTLSSTAQPCDSSTRFQIRRRRRASVDPDHLKPRRALRNQSINDLDISRRACKRLAPIFKANQRLV